MRAHPLPHVARPGRSGIPVVSALRATVRRQDAGRRWHPWGQVTAFPEGDPMPAGMNWEVWTGTAPMHPYSKRYDPGDWRGWYEYGNGAFGDWGPHTLDCVHRFLELGLPHEIRADHLEGQNDFVYPMASTIAFEFAARGDGMPAMTVYWYDGVKNPPKPPDGVNVKVPACGKIIYSDDLIIKGGTLRFDTKTKQITNNERANQLLKGHPPRKGWEPYYKLA